MAGTGTQQHMNSNILLYTRGCRTSNGLRKDFATDTHPIHSFIQPSIHSSLKYSRTQSVAYVVTHSVMKSQSHSVGRSVGQPLTVSLCWQVSQSLTLSPLVGQSPTHTHTHTNNKHTQTLGQSVSQSLSEWLTQWVTHLLKHSLANSVSRSVSSSHSQSLFTLSVNQSLIHSLDELVHHSGIRSFTVWFS